MKVTVLRNNILMFLLIATSGIQFFYLNEQWLIIGLVLSFIFAASNGLISKIEKSFIIILFVFVFWEAVQNATLGVFSIRPLLGTFSRISFAYFVIKILNRQFIDYFLKLMKFFIYISLFFYLLFYITPELIKWFFAFTPNIFNPIFGYESEIYKVRPNIIIFNFHGFELYPMRNSGPFWEPGAFAVYLNIAIFINVIKDSSINFKNLFIYIVALLTTLSTSGIFVLFFIVIYGAYFSKQKSIVKYAMLPFFLYVIFMISGYFDFLLPKLQQNIDVASETTASRFGSALADWELFKRNPILGYGRNLEIAYDNLNIDFISLHRNNGLTKIFVQWGVLAILYLYFIWKSLKHINVKIYKSSYPVLFSFIVLLALAFSQNIFRFSFFYGMMLWQFIRIHKPQNVNVIKTSILDENP